MDRPKKDVVAGEKDDKTVAGTEETENVGADVKTETVSTDIAEPVEVCSRCSRNVEGSFGRYPARNARSRNGSETWLFEV